MICVVGARRPPPDFLVQDPVRGMRTRTEDKDIGTGQSPSVVTPRRLADGRRPSGGNG